MTGRWRRIDRCVWAEGPDEPSQLDRARAAVLATGGVASHHLAAVLHDLDSVRLDGVWVTVPRTASGGRKGVSRRDLPPDRVVTVAGLRCTDGRQTLVDLAPWLSDLKREEIACETRAFHLSHERRQHPGGVDARLRPRIAMAIVRNGHHMRHFRRLPAHRQPG